jgi:hypothetical protein
MVLVDTQPIEFFSELNNCHKILTFPLKTTELFGSLVSRLEAFMEKNHFDSPNQAVTQLMNWLGMERESYLAGFLGVSPKSLTDWKKRPIAELPPKSHRLVRLFEVVSYLKNRHPELHQRDYKNLLENGRLVIDPEDEDEGSISLLNFIVEEPDARVWRACVEQVVSEFKNVLRATGRLRETDPSIRKAN